MSTLQRPGEDAPDWAPDEAPYQSDRVPHPTRDSLPAAVRELADVLGRPMLAKRLAEKLEPVLLVELTARIRDLTARASLAADDRVTADKMDQLLADAFARMAAATDEYRSRELEGDGAHGALHRERFEGVSRLG